MLYQLSHFRSDAAQRRDCGAESQSRTGDTAIFSRVLYQLSYLGPAVSVSPKRLDGVAEDSTGPFGPQSRAVTARGLPRNVSNRP